MYKHVWNARLPILIGAFAGTLAGKDFLYAAFYIVAFGFFVYLLDLIITKSYPDRTEKTGCGIVGISVMSMIIIFQLIY